MQLTAKYAKIALILMAGGTGFLMSAMSFAFMFKLTQDHRLIFNSHHRETEILGFVNYAQLHHLRAQLLTAELNYRQQLFGLCPFVFLTSQEYQVLKLAYKNQSVAMISQQLQLDPSTVRCLIGQLKQKYKLWAFDLRYQPLATCHLEKFLVSDLSFSQLLTEDDLQDLETVLPHDHGREAASWLSNFEAADLLNLLTSAQKQTAILLEQGYTPVEIGQKLGVSTQEVYQKIIRIRKQLLKNGYVPQV